MTVSILIAAGAAVIVILLALWIFFHNYIKSPPDQVAIFTGRGEMKVVRGGARFKVPGLERVDYMPLRPFEVRIALNNARSIDGVPVELQAVGLVRIGTTDEMTRTAAQRFLTANMAELENQINEILAGSLRGIAATMTVEHLNSNREALARGVVEEAGGDLARIGMEVDILKIAGIEDRNGYLESLGQKRIAEVKRDADIGKAEAERDSLIRSADARRAGEIAQTEAETAIAEAQQSRDVRIAQLRAQTEAQNAEADQAGPLAKARAEKNVGIALEEAEAARIEARTEVERKRRAQAEAALEADVIAPAEAQRQAAITRAEGERQSAILTAEARANSTRLDGESAADARKSAAAAVEAELRADAAGKLAQAEVHAESIRLEGESKATARKSAAEALEAELRADAAGKQAQAEAFNKYSADAARLLLVPQVLATIEGAVRSQSEATAAIDSINIIGGGQNDATGGLLGLSAQSIASIVSALRTQGIDLSKLLDGDAPAQAASVVGTPAAEAEAPVTVGDE
ncbi:flotillin family protein [Tsukamurella paurometabola]|uniref:Inner membrane protein yqiK n=1 Tax=Tsukamurella paurometabola TaxID=2061 RepID=A0A3P8K771_TSUPA|nr:flotillin family protein [Tsukamurella paurometabola]UEA83501.1 flotillin family protein [Tsukamurella paurometabola]VDR40624.1 Inner membrane protein yqiK [Tsukamurella paurometabola]